MQSVKASRYRFVIIHYVRKYNRNIVHHLAYIHKKNFKCVECLPIMARLLDNKVFCLLPMIVLLLFCHLLDYMKQLSHNYLNKNKEEKHRLRAKHTRRETKRTVPPEHDGICRINRNLSQLAPNKREA